MVIDLIDPHDGVGSLVLCEFVISLGFRIVIYIYTRYNRTKPLNQAIVFLAMVRPKKLGRLSVLELK